MKQVIILAVLVLMAGTALAHDPNDLPGNKQWQMSVGNENILTLDMRLPPRYVKILSKLTHAEITKTLERMVRTWEVVFRRNWFEKQKTENMN